MNRTIGAKLLAAAVLVGFLASIWDKPTAFGIWTELIMGGTGLLAIEYANDSINAWRG